MIRTTARALRGIKAILTGLVLFLGGNALALDTASSLRGIVVDG